jgi:hypothetical protein
MVLGSLEHPQIDELFLGDLYLEQGDKYMAKNLSKNATLRRT